MEFDASDFASLAIDLEGISARTHAATRGVFREAAHEVKESWRANASETAGTHARHYPYAITWEENFGTSIEVEIGPDESKLQGKLGDELEFGTATSPPHLDGQRAADKVLPTLERRAALAAEDVFRDA
jgi:hypothetical protein